MSSYIELKERIKELQMEAELLRAAEIGVAITEIKKKIEEFGLTPEQLGFVTPGKKSGKNAGNKADATLSKVVYRNGDMTWSGRGRKPAWINKIQSEGGDIEKYRVADGAGKMAD
jgi:DNA-binding protein H-NS